MDDTKTGWAFVAAQIVLLAAIVFLPGGSSWDTGGWVTALSWLMRGVGLVALLLGAATLGSSLTPTPVPVERGQLKTAGLYGLVRHPIYTGVMVIVIAIALTSGSVAKVLLAVIIVGFFHVKARWEEAALASKYPDYRSYAASVPRFVPRP